MWGLCVRAVPLQDFKARPKQLGFRDWTGGVDAGMSSHHCSRFRNGPRPNSVIIAMLASERPGRSCGKRTDACTCKRRPSIIYTDNGSGPGCFQSACDRDDLRRAASAK
jgi:hypothetical protein